MSKREKKAPSQVISIYISVAAILIALGNSVYTYEINGPTLSRSSVKVEITFTRQGNRIAWEIPFEIKNSGNEPLRIREIQIAHFDYNQGKWYFDEKKPLVGLTNPGEAGLFTYRYVQEIVNPDYQNMTGLEGSEHHIVGDHAIFLVYRFKGTSIFSKLFRETVDKRYYFFKGSSLAVMSNDEYKELEKITSIPEDFDPMEND